METHSCIICSDPRLGVIALIPVPCFLCFRFPHYMKVSCDEVDGVRTSLTLNRVFLPLKFDVPDSVWNYTNELSLPRNSGMVEKRAL